MDNNRPIHLIWDLHCCVGLSVSVYSPSFHGVSCTVGANRLLSAAFQLIECVESVMEPVGERNHSDLLFSRSEIVYEKRNGSNESEEDTFIFPSCSQ